MIDSFKKIELSSGVHLHLLNSSKFKTVLFGVYIQRPLSEEEVAKNALISKIIEKCSAKYNSLTEIHYKLEDLYGSILVSDVHKYGEKQMIQVKMQVPSDYYVQDEALLDESVQFLNAVINEPLVEDGGMGGLYFESEMEGLLYEIRTRQEDRKTWAIGKCIESMCEAEPYAIHEIGTEDMYDAITKENLYAHYQKMMSDSPIDIIVIGHYDAEAMEKRIRQYFHIEKTPRISLKREQVIFEKPPVRVLEESFNVKQCRLVMGYRMNVPYEDPAFIPSLLGTMILGSGGSSKLFRDVREKEGLCYSIFARADKYKSILLIYAGMDSHQMDKTEQLILEKVKEIQLGQVTEEELNIAKQGILSTLVSMSDYPNSYINFYYGEYIAGNEVDLEAYEKKLMAVTVAEVAEAAKRIELEQIYRMHNREAVADATH